MGGKANLYLKIAMIVILVKMQIVHPEAIAWPSLRGLSDGVKHEGRGVGSRTCLLQLGGEE